MKKIQAVIFDWAGTVVDYGCFAPMQAFMKAFAQASVPISAEEARGPMGLLKRDHIQAILNMERVNRAWTAKFGQPPSGEDTDRLYAAFEPALMETLEHYTDLIPGVPQVVRQLREAGIKIGSTTGYTRSMMEVVVPAAKSKGYSPDYWISSDEVKAGRPYPYMIYRNLLELEVYPPLSAVKIGDTEADVREGKNAGVWSVAVILGSSELGLTEAEAAGLPAPELSLRMERVRRKFKEAGADYVMDSIDQLPAMLAVIDARLEQGGGEEDRYEPIL